MRLFLDLIRQLRYWDRASLFALIIALILLVILSLLTLMGDPDLQPPLLAGSIGLLIAIQIIVMWGNRHMVTPFYAAQRAYLAGNFEEARVLLQDDIATYESHGKTPPIDHLVLLGNLYRQMGDLQQSADILRHATEIKPSYHFPLYGYGRTLLVLGDYEAAALLMQQALQQGAPESIKADILHALYRAQSTSLSDWFTDSNDTLESYRQLMQDWILHRVTQRDFQLDSYPPEAIAFWQAEIKRFAGTPYATALSEDLSEMDENA